MAKEINPFLMFASGAEAAMNFYLSLFPGSRIETLVHYDAAGPGVEGSVKQATLLLNGRRLEFSTARCGTPSPSRPRFPSPSPATMAKRSTGFSTDCPTPDKY
jgi:uncharacterized glyoxalase superfamily protein PhnB